MSDSEDGEDLPQFFKVFLSETASESMLIPKDVVKEHDLKFGKRIRYLDEERSFFGERGVWADDRVCFKQWDRICRRSRIKEEDTVKCELLLTGRLFHSVKITVKRG